MAIATQNLIVGPSLYSIEKLNSNFPGRFIIWRDNSTYHCILNEYKYTLHFYYYNHTFYPSRTSNKLTMMQGYIQIIWIRKTYIIDDIPLLNRRFDYVIYKYFYLNIFILIYTFTFIHCYNNQTGPINLQSLSKICINGCCHR